MSLPIMLTLQSGHVAAEFNAESIVAIHARDLHSVLTINDDGKRTQAEVAETPLSVVNRIDEAARQRPEEARGSALFVQLMDNTEDGVHTGFFANKDQITRQERLGERTRVVLSGEVRLVDESPETIKALSEAALANRLPPPPKPWERTP